MMQVFWEKNYIPQDVEISVWDRICLSTERMRTRNFGQNIL